MIKENKDFIMIDFTGLFRILARKIWLILLVGVIGLIGAWGYAKWADSNVQITPMYKATAKLYVTGNEMITLSTNTKLLGQSFFNDYYELMKSEKVISYVIDNLQLNMTNSELIRCISVKMVSNTCMVYLSVTFPEPQLAKAIVDDLIRVTSAYALEIIGMVPPKVYEEAAVPVKAIAVSGIDTKQYAIFGFAGGAAIALFLIVVCFFADKKVRTFDNIAEKLYVPVFTSTVKRKGKHADGYNRYAMRHMFEQIYLVKKDAKSIGFISTGKEEKEQLISEYGVYLQSIGKKVIMLDTSLFNPRGNHGSGLIDYLTGKTDDLSNIIYEKDGIDCIDCSEGRHNAVELLNGPLFEQLIRELEALYDYILVNTSSMENSAEAKIVMHKVDINLLVVECDKTTYPSCEVLEEYYEDSLLTGAVVNNVRAKSHNRCFRKLYGKYFGIN